MHTLKITSDNSIRVTNAHVQLIIDTRLDGKLNNQDNVTQELDCTL